jgi:1,4-alpha-glucan branching enzyme
VRDLNRLYVAQPALHALDCQAEGFQWLVADDAAQSVFAWMRLDADGGRVLVASNFTPQPRPGYRIGVPAGAERWRVALDSDAPGYGGSGFAAASATVTVQAVPAHGQAQSLLLDLPPLATVFLVPA